MASGVVQHGDIEEIIKKTAEKGEREFSTPRSVLQNNIKETVATIIKYIKQIQPYSSSPTTTHTEEKGSSSSSSSKEYSKEYLLYLEGKAKNLIPDLYDKDAELLLSKAVKLDPSLREAWIALGECYWKKGDPIAAKNCFMGAMQHPRQSQQSLSQPQSPQEEQPHTSVTEKIALRCLSMVSRQLPAVDAAEKKKNIEEGIRYAKDAVALDIQDSKSWYILGNAYLANFFCGGVGVSQLLERKEDKDKALTAYQLALNKGQDWDPDLHYNRAILYSYTENYAAAVVGFERAATLYPEWGAPRSMATRVREHVRAVSLAMVGKSIKPKRLPILISAAQAAVQALSHSGTRANIVPLSALVVGANPGVCICVKVGVVLTPPVAAMASLIVVDAGGGIGSVSLYYIEPVNIMQGETVIIHSPIMHSVSVPSTQTYCTITADYPSVELSQPFNKDLLATPTLTLNVNEQKE